MYFDHWRSGPADLRDRSGALFKPGYNCWRVDQAPRSAVIIDGAEYFRHLDDSLRQARRSIWIIGWDFDGSIRLSDDPGAPSLGPFLRSLVDAHPLLEVRVLVWSLALVHAPSPALPLLLGEPWQQHPRIAVKLDTQHPIYAAHHQKIVVIDDSLAFAGGIDLTGGRCDTCCHHAHEPLRAKPDGTPCEPVHDVQMAVTGPAAASLGAVARERWAIATGAPTVPVAARAEDGSAPWPSDLPVDFAGECIAIARTLPRWKARPPALESQAMIRDMLMSAKRHLYIEAQYVTARYVRAALRKLLRRPEGPEIVIILNKMSEVLVERIVMGENGARMIRALRRADRHGRLRIYYPVVPSETGEVAVHIHSKLIIADDRLLRVGSANLNNRSVGLDTECDLAVEASDEAARATIADFRNRLVAEHIAASPEAVADALSATGSLIRTIDTLNDGPRGLRAFPASPGPAHFVAGTRFLDPEAPFEPGWLLRLRPYRRHPGAWRATPRPQAARIP
ncbi:Phosphatidylserine/phosphatidylglycerophosphate/cardiolipin synthase [Kaistia soli DSM 19436]|uniref:Phospholipase D n=1 Tax=Kaistia soli DSM 19436 TaxID=1122133 RepID=A0A1M5IK49_9HYPH|nr:Phosphatidylserine/phosphatidylglycerophosphate/cardiolipin synthase [Kaistia soli DSM 19436]